MEDRSQQVLAVAILFFILSWLTVLLRIYVRAGMLKSFGLDDWLMVTTQVRDIIPPFQAERRRNAYGLPASSYSLLTSPANSEELHMVPVVIFGI